MEKNGKSVALTTTTTTTTKKAQQKNVLKHTFLIGVVVTNC